MVFREKEKRDLEGLPPASKYCEENAPPNLGFSHKRLGGGGSKWERGTDRGREGLGGGKKLAPGFLSTETEKERRNPLGKR